MGGPQGEAPRAIAGNRGAFHANDKCRAVISEHCSAHCMAEAQRGGQPDSAQWPEQHHACPMIMREGPLKMALLHICFWKGRHEQGGEGGGVISSSSTPCLSLLTPFTLLLLFPFNQSLLTPSMLDQPPLFPSHSHVMQLYYFGDKGRKSVEGVKLSTITPP